MAFRDRRQMWEDLGRGLGCEITTMTNKRPGPSQPALVRFFKQRGQREFVEPLDADGPDGKGEDRFIKTPDQLENCLTEIVSQLTSLQTFEWQSPVMAMPIATCSALATVQTLTSLHLSFAEHRSTVYLGEWKPYAPRV